MLVLMKTRGFVLSPPRSVMTAAPMAAVILWMEIALASEGIEGHSVMIALQVITVQSALSAPSVRMGVNVMMVGGGRVVANVMLHTVEGLALSFARDLLIAVLATPLGDTVHAVCVVVTKNLGGAAHIATLPTIRAVGYHFLGVKHAAATRLTGAPFAVTWCATLRSSRVQKVSTNA
ncbi:unnamed protein product [Trypanosoma congolense IL3000]|uniref:WGS project CAEQ00000000 data, annotated contig 1513 n=1 Tax=Trypanosoma congolense (strain IL3000) TaxID=1068625 RepID=F9W6R9_TRYCI|nr:unnamed protein product [Trypanosoma congolense IL3000]